MIKTRSRLLHAEKGPDSEKDLKLLHALSNEIDIL